MTVVWVPADTRSQAAARNPRTPVPILAQLAMHTPELREEILANDATPPELRTWILNRMEADRRDGRSPRPGLAVVALVIAALTLVLAGTALSAALLMGWQSWPLNIAAAVSFLISFAAIQLALRW